MQFSEANSNIRISQGTWDPNILPRKKELDAIYFIRGAQSNAVIYNIAQTARANSIRQYEYFKYLQEKTPKHEEFDGLSYLDDLLPWSESLMDFCRKPKHTTNECSSFCIPRPFEAAFLQVSTGYGAFTTEITISVDEIQI